MGRPFASRISVRRALLALAATSLLLSAVTLAAASAVAAPGDCANAKVFQSLDRLTTAVRLYDRARDDGQSCGSGKQATAVRRLLERSESLVARGSVAELLGSADVALERYRDASRLNAENEVADAGIARLTVDPFAATEHLEELGRIDEATAAALAAVQEGADPASNATATRLLERNWFDKTSLAIRAAGDSLWLVSMATLLLAAVLWFGMRRLARTSLVGRRWFERVTHLRLAVQVTQASGTEPDLAEGFAVQVRTRVRELGARYANDPRVVIGPEAPVDVPLEALPEQAKFLAAAWNWLRSRNVVTLRVTLLPASPEGVACHVILMERNGQASKGVGVPEQTLRYRPAEWNFQPSAPTSSLHWMPLANLATAWALFAFRSLQVGHEVLQEEFGTSDGRAYGHMLAGLEHGDSPKAMRHFRKAIEIDHNFVEAQLNLASALGNHAEDALDEAEKLLRADVLPRLHPPETRGHQLLGAFPKLRADSFTNEEARRRGLQYRAAYSLAMVRFNRLAPELGQQSLPAASRRLVHKLTADLGKLSRELHRVERSVPVSPTSRAEKVQQEATQRALDVLATLRAQMRTHVDILFAGALDLKAKLSQGLGSESDGAAGEGVGYAGLPLTLERKKAISAVQGRAVDMLAKVPMTGTPTRIHYTIACTWARDARMRASGQSQALDNCAARLHAALEDPELARRWPGDPDLAPIRDKLVTRLDDLEATRRARAGLPDSEADPAQLVGRGEGQGSREPKTV